MATSYQMQRPPAYPTPSEQYAGEQARTPLLMSEFQVGNKAHQTAQNFN